MQVFLNKILRSLSVSPGFCEILFMHSFYCLDNSLSYKIIFPLNEDIWLATLPLRILISFLVCFLCSFIFNSFHLFLDCLCLFVWIIIMLGAQAVFFSSQNQYRAETIGTLFVAGGYEEHHWIARPTAGTGGSSLIFGLFLHHLTFQGLYSCFIYFSSQSGCDTVPSEKVIS